MNWALRDLPQTENHCTGNAQGIFCTFLSVVCTCGQEFISHLLCKRQPVFTEARFAGVEAFSAVTQDNEITFLLKYEDI